MGTVGRKGFRYENWAKTFSCQPELYFEPTATEELKTIIKNAALKSKKVKITGFAHSPSDIGCTEGFMVSLKKLNRVLEVDSKAQVVKVESGILLKELNPFLEKHGLALENLPAVDEVSVGGLLSTGSHNSGIEFGIIATQVLEFELMKSDGEVVLFSKAKDLDLFNLAVVGLGALGVITSVKLQCLPSFNLLQVEEPCSFEELLSQSMEQLEVNLSKSEYFKLLYLPHVDRCINVHINKTNQKPRRISSWLWDTLIGFYVYQFILFCGTLFPFIVPTINKMYNSLMLSKGREECDKSYKILHFNCLFKQHVIEWCIPREKLPELLFRLRKEIKEQKLRIHLSVEIRFGKGDDIALSPCYKRDTAFMNALMFRPFCHDQPDTKRYFDICKKIAMDLDGRPHWAKHHEVSAAYLRRVYPKMNDFVVLKKQLDPNAMFENSYIQRHIN